MNRRICSAMIGSLFVAVSVSAQTTWTSQSGLPVSPSAFSQPLSANAVADVLSERVDSVDWVDRTFEEVIQWVRERGDARINIVPRWNHLGVEGISRDSLVTLQLNNTNVADVLNEALMQLSDSDEVRYRGLRNKLTISTRADFERKLHTKVYDVTDILFQVPDFGQGAPLIDLKRAAASGGGGGGGSKVTAGSIGFLAAASAAVASFFYTASFESFATKAIVAAVVFVAIYFTLTKPLRALSSAIAAILNGIFAVAGFLLRIVIFGALAVGVVTLMVMTWAGVGNAPKLYTGTLSASIAEVSYSLFQNGSGGP
ncbi:MAG: hypothetical protein IIB59_03485, partial [Planctomycetes bacterium]|nr:hypothetical protein [Planctomycetota bacterium]